MEFFTKHNCDAFCEGHCYLVDLRRHSQYSRLKRVKCEARNYQYYHIDIVLIGNISKTLKARELRRLRVVIGTEGDNGGTQSRQKGHHKSTHPSLVKCENMLPATYCDFLAAGDIRSGSVLYEPLPENVVNFVPVLAPTP